MENQEREELAELEESAIRWIGDSLKYLSWVAVVWTIGGLAIFGVPWIDAYLVDIPIPLIVWLGLVTLQLALYVRHEDYRRLRNLQRQRAMEEGVGRGYDDE